MPNYNKKIEVTCPNCGIKYRGTGKKMNAMDDCYKNNKKIPCAFQAFSSYNAMVQGWANVLNLPRYKNCKRYMFAKYNRGMSAKNIVDATCKCQRPYIASSA